MDPLLKRDYDIKTGTVFTFQDGGEEFVVCEVVTHQWNPETKQVDQLSDPKLIVRSVRNINERSPVPHERIETSLSLFKGNHKYIPLSMRK